MHLVNILNERFNQSYLKGMPNARVNSLGFVFMRLRQSRGASRSRIALECGVSVGYLKEFEDGNRLASVAVCLWLGNAFGVNPEWVKAKWVKEAVEIYSESLRRELGVIG